MKSKTRLIGTPIWNHLPIVLQKKLFVTLQDILVVIIIFVSVLVLGTIFLKFAITRPLNEVSRGFKSIAGGNFSRRINVRFGGEFGDLSSSVNELGRRLKMYEEANRKQIVSEKIANILEEGSTNSK